MNSTDTPSLLTEVAQNISEFAELMVEYIIFSMANLVTHFIIQMPKVKRISISIEIILQFPQNDFTDL